MSGADQEPLQMAELHSLVALRLLHQDLRYTSRRRRLVETLASSGQPLTLPQIRRAAPDLATSSAYRNLELLERSGVVQRLNVGGGHAHFELAEPLVSHHHHLFCMTCGKVQDIDIGEDVEEQIRSRLAIRASDADFTPMHHSLELHGRCRPCESSDNVDG